MTNPETPELLPCPFEWFNRRVNKMRHEGEGLTFYMSCSEIERMKEAERLYKQATGPSPCFICGGDGYICGEFQNEAMACTNCQDRPTPTAPENVNKQAEILHDKNICKEKTENFTKAPETAEALGACDHIEGANNCHISIRGYYCFDPIHLDKIRAALNQPRTVKPLVWNDDGVKGFAYATTPLFFYEISLNDAQTHYTLTCDSDWIGDFKTLEEAKAAAEAHWQAKIRECLG